MNFNESINSKNKGLNAMPIVSLLFKLIIYAVMVTVVSSCIGKNDVEVNLKNPKKAIGYSSLNVTVSNIQVVNHQVVITGTNLNTVSGFQIKEGSSNTNLQIESKTSTTIIANTVSDVTFVAGKVFDFILSNAQAASTFTVNFSLCDSLLGGKGFDCTITPTDKQVLAYDAQTGKWKPKNINGLDYRGTWDASTDEPAATIAGEYWIVSVAQGEYDLGDWIVFNGTSFDKIDNSQAIISVFGRTGAITADLNDLSDVIITAPVSGQILKFDGTSWVNAVNTFTETDPNVTAFAKTTLPTCGAGEVLKADGSSLTCIADNTGAGAFSGAADRAVITDGAGALATSSVTSTILNYLSNVTSDIQAQINAKLNTSSFVDWGAPGIQTIAPTRINLTTANRVVVTNGSSNPSASSVTSTELGYLSGATSNIQAQLNSKLSSFTETDPNVTAFAKAPLPTCNAGEVLKANGTTLTCVTDNTGAGAYTGTQNRVVLTDGASGALTTSTVTNTEVGYLSGVTSSIQTQLNNKQSAGKITTNTQDAGTVNPYGASAGQTGEFRFYELAANGANYTGFKSPDILGTNIIYTLPQNAPNTGEVLSSNSSGVLSWVAIPSAPVTSVNGLTGTVSLTTTNINEGTNLYHSATRVLGTQITAPTLTNSAIATSDTIQVSLGKLQAQINTREGSLSIGTAAQYYRGDKTLQTLNTSAVPEGTGLYFTDARARSATVADAIADAVTNIAPSQNAVFDALALKLNSGSFIQWDTNGIQTIDPSRLNLGAGNASKAVVSNGTGAVVASSVTATELGYLSGVTSSLQTQLNSKISSQWSGAGPIYYNGNVGIGTNTPTSRLEIAGQVKITGGSPGNGKVLSSDATGLATWKTLLPLKGGVDSYYNQSLQFLSMGSFNTIPWSLIHGETYLWGGQLSIGGNASYLAPVQIRFLTNPAYTSTAGSGQERMRINDIGNVGIGTASPNEKLSVNGVIYSSYGGFKFPDGTTMTTAFTNNNVLSTPLSGISTGSNLAVTSSDSVLGGIGKLQRQINDKISSQWTSGTGTISYAGTVIVDRIRASSPVATDCVSGWTCNANFWDISIASLLYSGLSQRSDRRLKKDIHNLETEKIKKIILALNPVSYKWIDEKIKGIKFGFIAQEVEKVFPEIVNTNSDKMKTKSLDYTLLISPLVKFSQYLFEQIELLNKSLQNLRDEGEESKNKIKYILIELRSQSESLEKLKQENKILREEIANIKKNRANK